VALLLLFALFVVLPLAESVLGAITDLLALGVLACLFLVSLAVLPWYVALAGWGVLIWLVVHAARRNVHRKTGYQPGMRARIRDLERQAEDFSLPFETRAASARQVFRLRCELGDWEGFPGG